MGSTTGSCEGLDPIHFLNIGFSKEHVIKAVEALDIHRIVVFTSTKLKDEAESFCKSLEERGITVLEVVEVDPFKEESLGSMIKTMLDRVEYYGRPGRETIVTGLTGGTNLMAIALGTVSLVKGLRCYYVLDGSDRPVLNIDLFERAHGAYTIDQLVSRLREG